jgi:hypothetical protein
LRRVWKDDFLRIERTLRSVTGLLHEAPIAVTQPRISRRLVVRIELVRPHLLDDFLVIEDLAVLEVHRAVAW